MFNRQQNEEKGLNIIVLNVLKRFLPVFTRSENMFLFWGLIGGLAFSLALPVFQVPDECSHFFMMFDLFGTEELTPETSGLFAAGGGYDRILNADIKVDESYFEYGMTAYDTRLSLFDLSPKIGAIKYLPQAMGFYIAYFLKFPPLICAQVAEFFSLAFFLFMGYCSIRIIPIKKYVMLFWLLAPMTLQQCASISYDAVLIPCCFLLTAYVLKLKCSEEAIGWRNMGVIAILTMVIAITKLPYILIAGMIFMLPIARFEMPIGKGWNLAEIYSRIRIPVCVMAMIVLALGMWRLRGNVFVKYLWVAIRHPHTLFRLLRRSFAVNSDSYILQSIGDFGYLVVPVCVTFEIIFAVVLTYVFLKDGDSVGKDSARCVLMIWDRAWMILLALGVVVLVFISMFSWTFNQYGMVGDGTMEEIYMNLRQLDHIDGVQGRYFIPVIPLVLFAIKSKTREEKHMEFYVIQNVYVGGVILYSIFLILRRYWLLL